MTAPLIAHLRGLLEQSTKLSASPLPWSTDDTRQPDIRDGDDMRVAKRVHLRCDAALIVATINHLALLLDVAEAAEAHHGTKAAALTAEWYASADALGAALARLREAKP